MTALPLLPTAAVREVEGAHATAQPPLMERAGKALADMAQRVVGARAGCVLILAGPGNNGGDGFVMARHLLAAGREVRVVCATSPERMPEDARRAYAAWMSAGGQVVQDFLGSAWVLAVDAIFGIGLKRPPEGRYADWIARLNALACPVLAVDVPSGLDADTGKVHGTAVRATHTLSFIAHKPGLFTLDGPDHAGECELDPLGLLSGHAEAGAVLARAHFADVLQARARNTHKGNFGQAGVIGGAPTMAGAALLSARAALHLGAGRVYVGLLDAQALAVDLVQPELMLRAAGDLHLMCNALAIGPGLGTSEAALLHLRRASGFPGALVLDADALNLLAATPSLQPAFSQRDAPVVLTPHPAEAARLLQCSTADVQADRVAMCKALARRYRADVVLKGAGSVIVLRDGRWFINATGNAGLASAGTGDVLTGFILALLAAGHAPGESLLAAVHLHGAAADQLLADGVGPIGLTAGELIPAARKIFNAWVAEGVAR